MMEEFTYILRDFTFCKFFNGDESIIKERNLKISEKSTDF
jgi:hypothetical protein